MTQPDRPSIRPILITSGLVSLAIVGAAIWKTAGPDGIPFLKKPSSDSALAMPANGDPDMRFHLPAAWNAIGSPKAVRFDLPAGSENGALLKSGAPGEFTGIGGTNTALGDPVFAVADGKVTYAGEPSSELGKVIVISHTGPDGKPLQSVYARLDKTEVSLGSLVGRGTKIGIMGTANGHFPAGLLFTLGTGTIGSSFTPAPGAPDPRETLGKLRNAAPEALAPSPLIEM